MTTLTIRSKNIVNIVLLISMLFIPLQVFAYTLQIEPYEGTDLRSETGVAIRKHVPYPGEWSETSYYGLPPPSFNQYFSNYEMPVGSDFSVCAYYLNTYEQIGCEFYYRGPFNIESASIDLSPWD